MKPIRFIHCADLHIDTPFKGISEIQPGLQKLLYQSTYQAFNNIVDLAIEEKVDCVVIAGDIYDSENINVPAQLKFRKNLDRLSEAGIPTFIAYGNHDPLSSWSATLKPIDNVFAFPGDKVECFPLVKNGDTVALIYGISFAKRDITENLSLRFPRAEKRLPTIGVLHTNIGTNTGHLDYAPCSVSDLSKAGMDYWALGHVHGHRILNSSNPAVVYSGCSQGTNPREIGPKGCCLITLESGNEPEIQFKPTDIIRYGSTSIDISNCQYIGDVIDSIKDNCQAILDGIEGRNYVLRCTLTGRTDLHKEIQKGDSVPGILEEVRAQFSSNDPWIWLDKLELATAGSYDVDQLRQGNNLVADIISSFDELQSTKSQKLEGLREVLKPLFIEWRGSNYLDEMTDKELLELASQARNQMLDKLVTD